MAGNFLNQFPGFSKFPFGWGKPDEPHTSSSSSRPPSSGGYRARKSISSSHGRGSGGGGVARLEEQMSMSLINKGLLNPTGENNCFLNSAVQILWHIDVFRRSFRKVKGHLCVEKACIFCALKELFEEFQHGKQSVIPPHTLRQAMAECYEEQHRFQLGLMDDAAECFEKILEQLHLHLTGSENMDSCYAKCCLPHQKFSLTILERTECVCGATSEPLSFVQFIHYISSSAIAKEAQKYSETEEKNHAHSLSTEPKSQSSDHGTEDASSGPVVIGNANAAVTTVTRPRLYSASQVHFGRILNQASSFGEYRQCPDYARCKKTVAVKRILLNCPDVVCVGMIWDSAQPSVEDIMSVVLSIGLTLQLNDLFDHVFADGAQFNQYELTALIAYYGRHYSTFCYHSKMHEWIYFDDARFRTVGAEWADVCEEIRKAHYQPLLLVYTNPFGEEVDMSEAPQVVTKIQPTSHGGVTGVASAQATPPPLSKPVEAEPPKDSAVKAAESATPAPQKDTGSQPSIDPMTLSLVSFPRGTGTKSMSPVVGHNTASASSTSKGATPLSAQQLAQKSATPTVQDATPLSVPQLVQRTVTPLSAQQNSVTPLSAAQESSEQNLMSFSISPAVLMGRGGVVGGQGAKVAKVTTTQHLGEHQSESNDLIQFSLSPSLLESIISAPQGAKGQQMALSRSPILLGAHSPVVSGSHSHSSIQPGSQSAFSVATPVSQAMHSPVLPWAHSNSTLHQVPHSNTTLVSQVAPAEIRPEWEHFSDRSLNPVLRAPQKLIQIPPGSKVTLGSMVESLERSTGEPESIGKAWTVVTRLSEPAETCTSPAARQLQRIISQPEESVADPSDPSLGDFMLESMTLGENKVGVANHGNRKSNLVSRPLPPTPGNSSKDTLLDDLEFAYPHADHMFADAAKTKSDDGAKSGDRKFDYADLDLELSTGQTGVELVRLLAASTSDYATIKTDEPRYEFQTSAVAMDDTEDGYSKLSDLVVGTNRDRSQPIGSDPLYSTPDKSKRSTVAILRDSGAPIGQDPDYAVPAKLKGTAQAVHPTGKVGVASMQAKSRDMTREALSGLDVATRQKLHEAQDVFAKAEASAGNDNTVAMLLYQQFSSLLLQVLQDPVVTATPTLHRMIAARRAEGLKCCLSLQLKTSSSVPDPLQKTSGVSDNSLSLQKNSSAPVRTLQGHCVRCGRKRELDDQKLCGPCQLREKMKQR